MAKVQAALRKRAVPELVEPSEPNLLGDLTIDYVRRQMTVAGRLVQVMPTEYALKGCMLTGNSYTNSNTLILQRTVWQESNS